MLQLGHAVLQARDLVGNEPFAVMLSDEHEELAPEFREYLKPLKL